MRRGFKSWCENSAIQIRRELGLAAADPLDPFLLANHLGIPIWTPEQIPGLEEKHTNRLLREDPDSWSAVTVSAGTKDVIIINSAHSAARQASDAMHELSHIIIGHEPARVDFTEDGLLMLANYNRDQEEEAKWLSGCLLVPREALFAIRKQRMDLKTAAAEYGISQSMLQFRINVSGVDQQFRRARQAT